MARLTSQRNTEDKSAAATLTIPPAGVSGEASSVITCAGAGMLQQLVFDLAEDLNSSGGRARNTTGLFISTAEASTALTVTRWTFKFKGAVAADHPIKALTVCHGHRPSKTARTRWRQRLRQRQPQRAGVAVDAEVPIEDAVGGLRRRRREEAASVIVCLGTH